MAKKSKSKNGTNNYIDKQELKEEILKCKESKVVSEKLGKLFQLLVNNVARSFYWENPEDGYDCKSNALLDLCSNFWKYNPENGDAFAFCTQITYFGIAGAHRILHPKKYDGTISLTCLDSGGKSFDMYNI